MQASIRNSDNTILQYGTSLGNLDGAIIIDISASLVEQIRKALSGMRPFDTLQLSSSGQVVVVAGIPLPPITPPPNISGLVNALVASASIDQPTKNSLISALRGN